jgi:hypothetical protein
MTETCTIISKLEVSIQAQLQERKTVVVKNRDQQVTEEVWQFTGPKYTFRGCSVVRGQPQWKQYRYPNLVADGTAALTTGVPKDFAEEWFRQNADLPFVKNKLVYMAKDNDHAIGEAKERTGQRCGMHPLAEDDPRWPKKATVSAMYAGPEENEA